MARTQNRHSNLSKKETPSNATTAHGTRAHVKRDFNELVYVDSVIFPTSEGNKTSQSRLIIPRLDLTAST